MTDPSFPTDPRHGALPTPPTPPVSAAPPAPPHPPTPPLTAAPPAPPFSPVPAPQTFGETSFLDDTTTIHDTVEKKPSLIGRAGLVVAALAVAGGGAFAVTRALSEPAGPASPEEAVEQMFEAIENDDLVGIAEVMLPSERESLYEPMDELFDELARLEIIDADFDLAEAAGAEMTGLDFTVSGLSFTTTAVGEGVVNAQINAGTVRVVGEVSDLPVTDRVGDELGDEVMAESIDEQIVDFGEEDAARFTLVEEDGAWYVSLWYSVAEGIRHETDTPAPQFGRGVTPTGSGTPEDAVRLMMDRAVDLDLEGVIATLDPAEFRALHDYAPLFLDDVDAAAAELRREAAAEGVTWSLDRLDLNSTLVRGRTVVSVEGIAFSASAGTEAFSIDFDGDCVTVIEGNEIDQICLDDVSESVDVPSAYLDAMEGYTAGVTVVERDGGWYVSGMPTILGAYTDLLAVLEPEDIDELSSYFEESFNRGFGMVDPFFGLDPYGTPIHGDGGEFGEFEQFDDFEAFEEPEFEELEKLDDEFVQPTLDPAAVEVFLPGLEISAADADFSYFAGVTGFPATWYAYAYSNESFGSIEIVAFDVSAADLVAAMDTVDPYVRLEVDGLPDGAVAYEWPEVDRVIVIDNYLVSAYYGYDENQDLLVEQVQHIANP